MLRLSSLWAVRTDATTQGSDPVAVAALSRWGEALGGNFFRASASFVYRVRSGEHERWLRLTQGLDATAGSVKNEASLLLWVAGRGVPVARPISSLTGRLVETVDTELGAFHAVLFEAARGQQRDLDEMDGDDLRRWGAALANLHAAGDGFVAAAHEFDTDALLLEEALHSARSDAVVSEAEAVREAMAGVAPQAAAGAAWLHGDFELDNLFWDRTRITAIDFGEFFRGGRYLDVALALRDLAPSDRAEAAGVRSFLDGYNAASYAPDIDLELVTLGWRFAGLVVYSRLVRALDLRSDGDYPDWLRRLERKLTDHVERFEASLR